MLKSVFVSFCTFLALQCFSQSNPTNHIHLDQFGYLPEMTKVAVISNPEIGFNSAELFTPATEYEVIDVQTNEVVFTAPIQQWNNTEIHDQSGDIGWWFDFSELETPGVYRINDPENGSSYEFEISESIYSEVLRASTRMYYYNRANTDKPSEYAGNNWEDDVNLLGPLQDSECRYVFDQANENLQKDLSGGWFDAGDYNKYVTFAESAIHNLLWAYQENPNAFTDETGIPESGNGVPDILDEIKWELDWLLKMINADGSTHIKMGFAGDYVETYSPPSVVTAPRFYGPTCTSASLAASGMLAHAAEVYGEIASFTGYAETLRSTSENCFNYALPFIENNTLETECDDGTIQAGDADRSATEQIESALIAAIHLAAVSGSNDYTDFILEHVYGTEPLSAPFWGPYKISLEDALLHYSSLPNADSTLAQDIRDILELDAGNNYNGFFGFNSEDLYRAYMPDWSYHWGSNSPKAGYGVLNTMIDSYDLLQNNGGIYELKATEQLHYFHGVNPLGVVMLSNMYEQGAEHSVNQIYHGWFHDGTEWDHALDSSYGPPPGYVTGGPNGQFSIESMSPPANQPLQKSYLDFNNDWPDNSWEISEPAIYYQAIYIRLLANYVTQPEVIDNIEESKRSTIEIYPNPSSGSVTIITDQVAQELTIENLNGKVVFQSNLRNGQNHLNLSGLTKGIYFLRVGEESRKLVLE